MSQPNDVKDPSVQGCGHGGQERKSPESKPVNRQRQVRPAAASAPDAGRKKADMRPVSNANRRNAAQGASGRMLRKNMHGKTGKASGGKGALNILAAPFKAINKKLDVFRKDETSTVITNTLVSGVGVIAVLCIFFLAKPGIDSVRAGMLARSGESDKAIRIVNTLKRKEYPEDKLNRTRIKVARNLIEAGQQEWATSLIAEIPESDERKALEKEQNYARAQALYDAADYTGAAQAFYQLGDYEDSVDRYADSRCVMAIQAWQEGNAESARSLLIGVTDMVTHVGNAALQVTGDKTAAAKILESELFDEENLKEMERVMAELAAARDEMPEGRIAAGWGHTVILNPDGTVKAVGDDSKEQCRTDGWRNIKRVAAGAYHTVGLCVDGTVVATGNNTMGQCNVSEWTDIVAIAAGTASTIGLKADGSVVATGQHADKVAGWRGITFVTAGAYAMGGISENGSMLSSHKGAQMDMGVNVYDLSVCGPVSVGVLFDGSLVSSFEGAPAWENIVTATACESGILGIDVNGKVLTHFYNEGSYVDISVPGKAVAIESSGTHHVVLSEDGKVYAFGNNDFGQCDI